MPELFFLRGGAGGGIGRLLRDRGGLYGLYSAAAPWSSACLFLFPCDRASLSDGVLCAGSGALCDLFCIEGGRSRGRLVCMLLADAAAVAIPLLCVSRSQLLFAVLLALITYMQTEHQLNPIYVVFALAGLIVLYILLTIARSHDTAYLNTVLR